ncbi:MAG: ATP-grasp domain-containing protein [Oscillospiraceae bacterium]|jgi:predicted ATP-grasp superfamily ATP-dependent carboligase|nr:ATP-grasp domain-containing protein [Oscillospiraceae bacterium]
MTRSVIITDTKYRAVASVARELGRAGYRVIAHGDGVAARSRYVAERAGGDPLELAARENAVIFPGGAKTTAIMAARREEFSRYTLVATEEVLKTANDKTAVAQTARSLGIRVPETLDIADADSFRYPVIVKYVNGESLGKKAAERYAIAQNREQLDAAAEKMGDAPVFVSEYIAGAGYGVSVLMNRARRAVRVFCHERLREYPLTGGPSVMCRSVWCENMARDAVALLKELDFEGLAMVEFKGSADDYALLEINPRVWGSYPLSYLAGAGFADAFARAASGEALPEVTQPQYKLGVRMQYFLSGARWAIATRSAANVLRFASEIVNPRVKHGLWSWRDPAPGLTYMADILKRRGEA